MKIIVDDYASPMAYFRHCGFLCSQENNSRPMWAVFCWIKIIITRIIKMLIKYYDMDGNIHMLADVQDVTVLSNAPTEKPDDVIKYLRLDKSGSSDDKPARYVEYAKDGVWRLCVLGLAYICNDEGKTIHKLEVNTPRECVIYV